MITVQILVPSYNEEQNLKVLLPLLKRHFENTKRPYKLWIVDDGSKDQTASLVEQFSKEMPVVRLVHPTNYGVGQVFRTGFEAVVQDAQDSDIIVTMEADNTSDLKILEGLIEGVEQGADIALASCYAPGGGVEGTNMLRKILSMGANVLMNVLLPIRGVHTYSSFYRAHKTGFLRQVMQRYNSGLITQNGFVCVVELLLKFALMGAIIVEVPMVLKGNMREGKSKMKVMKTIRGYLHLMSDYYVHRSKYQRK